MHPTLSLYRRILFAAKRFPSKNRDKIFEEIRLEFRKNASLEPDSQKARACIKVAQDSYEHNLRPFVNFSDNDKEWVYNTTETPMPPPPGWKQDINKIASESQQPHRAPKTKAPT